MELNLTALIIFPFEQQESGLCVLKCLLYFNSLRSSKCLWNIRLGMMFSLASVPPLSALGQPKVFKEHQPMGFLRGDGYSHEPQFRRILKNVSRK